MRKIVYTIAGLPKKLIILYYFAQLLYCYLICRLSCIVHSKNRILKRLFIIRHAKSDQSFFGNDFERPLNERGRSDAPVMAKRLLEKQVNIDGLISSPAKRAKKTAGIFAETLGRSTDERFSKVRFYCTRKQMLILLIECIIILLKTALINV